MRKLLVCLLLLPALSLLFAVRWNHARGMAAPASLLIRGGLLLDGTGAPGREADIRIAGDRVEAIGTLFPRPGERVLDAKGRGVAPGFIDTHSHADGGLLETPDAETQIRQGITTAVVGQDGGSRLPLAKWFSDLEAKHVALNIASFVGHGTLRRAVLGEDNQRKATPREIVRMRALVAQEMQTGALGLSSGLEYDPGLYSTTEEVIALAQVAGQRNGIYISHVRDEENEALASFEELIRIAREAHLPAQISHIKLGSSPVWGKSGEVLKRMADARREGLDITADIYPYLYWQSTITVIIPTRNWDDRNAWKTGLAEIGGAGQILLTTYTPDPSWQGKTIAEIAAATRRDPVTLIQEIVRKTHGPGATGRESVVVTAMQEADLQRFLADPNIMFCTDGGLRPSHPRGAGSFPRILGRYVREQHILTLPEAIRKATSLPARRMGLTDRGILKPGNKADIVIFDPATVLDTATPATPAGPPIGISHVLVNGVLVLDDGRITGAHPGEVVRRGGRASAPIAPTVPAPAPKTPVSVPLSVHQAPERAAPPRR
ncbi:MAG: D-aminoacylase [Cytophagales bacterium]|nr:D-aminoacylase [Armatimonadota bacterium]